MSLTASSCSFPKNFFGKKCVQASMRTALRKPMLHVQARAPHPRGRAFDHNLVAETGGNEKARMVLHHRMAAGAVRLQIIVLCHAERALDQRRRAGVEKGEIARIEN